MRAISGAAARVSPSDTAWIQITSPRGDGASAAIAAEALADAARDIRARAGRATTAAAAATAARRTTATCRARASASRRVAQHAARRRDRRRRATARARCRRRPRVRAGARDAGERGIGGREDRHGRRAHRRREVREAGVDADDDLARCARAPRAPAASAAAARWRWSRPRASRSLRCLLVRRCPTAAASRIPPARSARAARASRSSGHSLSSRLVAWNASAYGPRAWRGALAGGAKLPARRPVDRVARARAAASARALSMKCWSRAMRWCTSSSQRRDRLADVRRSKPWRRPSRHARDERALDLLLQVEDRVVALARAARGGKRRTRASVARRSGALAPAPKRHRHDAADARVERDQRDEGLLGDPVDRRRRARARRRRDQRQRVHDIAERRRADDEHAHRGCSRAALRSARPHANHVESGARPGAAARRGARRTLSCRDVRTASPVAHRHHPRRRPRARGLPCVRALRGGGHRGRFGQPR